MTDTPQHIYDLQLKSWLAKPPMERLRQFMIDNDALYKFWAEVKPAAQTNDKVLLTKEMIQADRENEE